MAETLVVEILDQDWQRTGVTNKAISASHTDELGQVGDGAVEIPIYDLVRNALPNPDLVQDREGRFKIWVDDVVQFAGVIDAKSVTIDDDAKVSFGGKHRGIEYGYYNLGRFDYLGWHLRELLREFTRDNLAKQATLENVSHLDDFSDLYPAYQMVTGDPFKQNYWKLEGLPAWATFDLGSVRQIDAIRVMPQWWKDIDTGKFHYHQFTVEVSDDNVDWTEVASKGDTLPSSAKGHLFSPLATSGRYVRLTVTGSTDDIARIAQLMIYQDIGEIGGDTTYTVPFIENDDSGNVTTQGSVTRPIVPGAFQGDGVITYSYVTRLTHVNHRVTHTFRGVSDAVFFTSATNGAGVADIYVDGVFREQVSIDNNRYWFKGYDTVEDFGGPLADEEHTLEVRYVSGTVQVDYFNGLYQTSWRPIEDDDPSLAYRGNWTQLENPAFYNYFSSVSEAADNILYYRFTGDRVLVKGSKLPGYGTFDVHIDGVFEETVDTSVGSGEFHKQILYDWSGDYGDHSIRITTNSSDRVVIDRLEGNFNHTLYLRSRYETNLKVMIRMSEIIDSYIRFNHDGSLDLLGAVGDPSGTAILEGENEGGTIIRANVETDYTETGSAVLAIVNVNGELPIKAFIIDKEAVSRIGYKVVKLEQADAADQFLLNRQALQYLREKRKPSRAYEVTYDPDEVGDLTAGQTTRLYSPSSGLSGDSYRIGRITTTYVRE